LLPSAQSATNAAVPIPVPAPTSTTSITENGLPSALPIAS
jgi:hypothetical protein